MSGAFTFTIAHVIYQLTLTKRRTKIVLGPGGRNVVSAPLSFDVYSKQKVNLQVIDKVSVLLARKVAAELGNTAKTRLGVAESKGIIAPSLLEIDPVLPTWEVHKYSGENNTKPHKTDNSRKSGHAVVKHPSKDIYHCLEETGTTSVNVLLLSDMDRKYQVTTSKEGDKVVSFVAPAHISFNAAPGETRTWYKTQGENIPPAC